MAVMASVVISMLPALLGYAVHTHIKGNRPYTLATIAALLLLGSIVSPDLVLLNFIFTITVPIYNLLVALYHFLFTLFTNPWSFIFG